MKWKEVIPDISPEEIEMLDAFVARHPKWGNEGDPHKINKARMAAEAEAEGEARVAQVRKDLEAKHLEDDRLIGKGMRHKQSPSNHISNSVFFSLHSDSFNRSPIKRNF